ncbi:MAG: flagellar hook capping FlgD N-terminal domain-containing protein [Roseovarius sp.]
MEIGSLLQNNSLNASGGSSTGGSSAISSDFETFIKMLTVQMENQDPLNPVEASDFAVQLATFSNVEQAVLTNNLLSSLGAQIGAQSIAQLSGWVGMEARAEMPVEFSGTPVTLNLRPDNLADEAELVVTNNLGQEVSRITVPTQSDAFDWQGTDDFGNPLPDGTYAINVESFSADQLLSTSPVEVHAVIVEVRNDNGIPTLLMDSGQTVTSSQILGLSNPAS